MCGVGVKKKKTNKNKQKQKQNKTKQNKTVQRPGLFTAEEHYYRGSLYLKHKKPLKKHVMMAVVVVVVVVAGATQRHLYNRYPFYKHNKKASLPNPLPPAPPLPFPPSPPPSALPE